ncbi:MAG TPA: hypothetical protein VL084_04175 [Thermoanaerobaculia bacterium]|nr:hypothetical protein [Thermoanaerobaculia bacterium]
MSSRDDQARNPLRYAHDFIAPGVGGRRVFTILVPDSCRYACSFCPMGSVRRLPELFRTPHGLARLFLTAFRRGLCDGLYVTAGIPRHPVRAMARVLELLDVLRVHQGFRGYIHVKSVPGALPGQIQKIVHLADRVSYQLEPACRRALLENPMDRAPRGLELFTSPERAAVELRAALVESARRAPGPLPPPGEGLGRGAGQLALFSTVSPPGSGVSARR